MEKILRGFLGVFLIGVCFVPGAVFAEGGGPVEVKAPIADVPAPAPAASEGLLMSLLGPAGVGDLLKKGGINVYGYSEAGIMYDTTATRNGMGPTFLGFNYFKNTPMLNKVSLNIERTVDPTKKQFDVGFHAEGIFGTDAKFIHSNGLMDKQTGRYQWDLLQAYIDLAFPYLPMKLRVGKWIELAGFEHFSANIYGAFGDPAKALYSYSYQFLYAEPGTQTGALLTYVLNSKLTFDAGITEGWNQSIRDANHVPDFLGRLTYTPTDKTSVIFVMTEGPEFPIGAGRNLPSGDRSHWWNAFDLVVTHKVTQKWSVGAGLDYVQTPRIPGYTGGSKQWGGFAGYNSYALNQYFTLNTRAEWYGDGSKGFSTGNAGGTNANYIEVTQGVAIKPFPKNNVLSRLLIRPEVRYDVADHPVFAKGQHNQVTLSADALFTF